MAVIEPNDTGHPYVYAPLPKESWITKILPFVSGVVLFVVMYAGGLALHVWTSTLFYHQWGSFWGFAAFFSPVFAEVVALFACFGWHTWYYILAIALWLAALPAMTFAEDGTSRRLLLFIGWICLVCILSVGFGHYAWKYSLGPTSRTATDQTQLEDCATAVVAVLHASTSDDPRHLVALVTAKKEAKRIIQGYDNISRDQLCAIVNDALRCEGSLHNDLAAYMEKGSRTGHRSKFQMSDETKQSLDRLPSGLQSNFTAGVEESLDKLADETSNLPENWREAWDKNLARIWTTYGQTYSELLGRPMPPLTD